MGEKIFVTVFPSFATLSNVTFLCDFTGETDTGLHLIRCKLKPNQNARFQPSTVCKITIFARNGVGHNSQMIALKMAISSNMQGAKNLCSLHL